MSSFLELLLDPAGAALRDASHAQRSARDAMFHGDLALESVDQLRKQVVAQRAQIRDLGLIVATLVNMLGEANVLDPKIVRYRVDAAIDEAIESAKPVNRMVACARCRQPVAFARTEITGDGMVCDMCMVGAR